jgi:glycosyltransferase involved in cell wall biosynthesis
VATGFVDDLDHLFRDAALFVAPLGEGGGIKIKILEAMARGIPLVTTPIGAEGITRRDDDLVAWAEDPTAFAAAVVAAARDPKAASDRAVRARALVEEHFSWQAVVRRLEAVYRR